MTAVPKPLMLMILDGWGLNQHPEYSAIAKANKPNMDSYFKNYPNSILEGSGEAVGLPDGQMGNSEVGHLNFGAGRIVYQELTRITKAIKTGEFFTNETLLKAVDFVKTNDSALHLMGLLSDGGVHSHIEHVYGLLELAKKNGVKKVYIHAFLDGRDVPPANAKEYFVALQEKIKALGIGQVATIMGRYYSMDRDKRWDRVEKAYNAMVVGEGIAEPDWNTGMDNSYTNGHNDEFVIPMVIQENGKPVATINDKDAVIFFNFRPDRAREITRAFVDSDFQGFERKKVLKDIYYVCMTQYDETIKADVAFKPTYLHNTLGEVLGKAGLKQLRIAETEKYAHVTFFFNGGDEKANVGEERVLIASPKVATYDLQPEMSAFEVADAVVEQIKEGTQDVIILNFANPDMVGHTGVMEAAIKAIEAVDVCIGKVIDAVLEAGGAAFITADHGNADQMYDESTHGPHTAHTTNPVPFILVSKMQGVKLRDGILADVAPTMLELLNISKPAEMTGESLLEK